MPSEYWRTQAGRRKRTEPGEPLPRRPLCRECGVAFERPADLGPAYPATHCPLDGCQAAMRAYDKGLQR